MAEQGGFLVETASTGPTPGSIAKRGAAIAITLTSSARCEISLWQSSDPSGANGPSPRCRVTLLYTWDRDLGGIHGRFHPGDRVAVKLLLRRDMIELYLEEYLMPVYLLPPTTGRIGPLQTLQTSMDQVHMWVMSLPDTGWVPAPNVTDTVV